MVPLRLLVVFANDQGNAAISYQHGWVHAFARSKSIEATLVNAAQSRGFAHLGNELRMRRSYDAVVLLHSTFSNAPRLNGRLRELVRRHPAPKVLFVGNEYKLMPEKMAYAEDLGVRLLVSQTSNPCVHRMYAERLGCAVIGIPGAGLDTHVFRPTTDFTSREIDLGMRAFDEPKYFGHQERRSLANFFLAHAADYRLTVDISFEPSRRFTPDGYAAFLNRCRGQLGTESGTDYFELDDGLRRRVNDFMVEHPDAPEDHIRREFFETYLAPVSCRMLTGRHIEAAGTKTVQILFEGHYNGLFHPDVHYIALRKDFSNVEDVIARFRDDAFCRTIVDNAYQLTMTQLTYETLLENLASSVRGMLAS